MGRHCIRRTMRCLRKKWDKWQYLMLNFINSSTLIKAIQCWQSKRHIGQHNILLNPENTELCAQKSTPVNFDKEIQYSKGSIVLRILVILQQPLEIVRKEEIVSKIKVEITNSKPTFEPQWFGSWNLISVIRLLFFFRVQLPWCFGNISRIFNILSRSNHFMHQYSLLV